MAGGRRSIKPFYLFSNTGGQDEKSGEFLVQPNVGRVIQNMHVDAVGQWSAYLQGFDNLTSQLESGARVSALYWYTSTTPTDYLIAACNGKIKTVSTVDGTTANISSSFTAGQVVDFETFKGTMFAASVGLAVQKWSGTGSMSAASGWPITNGSESYDKPKIIEKYANRLAFANFNGATAYQSHFVVSDDLAPETFTLGTSATNGIAVQVSPGDGQVITCLRAYNLAQSNEQLLLVFKDRSLYTFTGNSPDTTSANPFTLVLTNPRVGCLNNQCAVQVGTDIAFMDVDNIYSYTTASVSGTIQPKAIGSDLVKDTLATLNVSQKDKCWALHLTDRQEIWFAIPTGSNTECDTILVYYYNTDKDSTVGAWAVRTGTSTTCGTRINRVFYTGNDTGYVNTWFGLSTYNGTSYQYIYRFPYYNFGTQAQNKRVIECYLHFLLFGNENITFETEWRGGGNSLSKSITVSPSLPGGLSYYGVGVYGVAQYTGAGVYKKVKVPVLGNGEMLQFAISGSSGTTAPIFLGISGLVEYAAYSRKYL